MSLSFFFNVPEKTPRTVWRVLVRDRDDRKFAALGAAAKRPLVTNDNHLLADRNI